MSFIQIISLLIIGLCAGFVSGSMGVGGGIIVVPALVFFMGLSQHQAQGTSLTMMMLPVGILGVINYYKAGYVKINYALFLMAAFILGSYLGSKFSIQLPEKTLKQIFGIFIILAGARIAFWK